ncbi:Alkane 1-monooxygenase, partial [Rhodococcus sp. AW25M09]
MTASNIDDQAQAPVAEWHDRKRYLWLMGLIPPTAVFMATVLVWAFNQLGWNAAAPVWWWIGALLVYGLLPILDRFFGPDGDNPPDEVMKALEEDKYYRYCTYAYIPFQLASLVFACYLWSADNLSWLGIDGGLGLISKIGLAISIGVMGGVGINT